MLANKYSTFAQIDTSAIVHNCNVFRGIIPKGCRICVAAKCNAYGHGIDIALPAFEQAGIEMLCVALIKEALQLRDLGWEKPILLLGSEFSIYNGRQKKEIAHWIVENALSITAVYRDDILTLLEAAEIVDKPANIHLMVDTGMSRMGLNEERVYELLEEFKDNKFCAIEGIYTHLATADETDKSYADYQLKRFNAFLRKLKDNSINIPIIHSANAGAAIDIPQSCFNMIRPGISIFGYHSSPQMVNKPDLKPSMKVVSHLTLTKHISTSSFIGYGCTCSAKREMLIGLVPIGFGDGYDRRLSNDGYMTAKGHLVPVIGRISMDQTILDLTELMDKGISIAPGDEVVVIDNERNSPNSVESLAVHLGTIPNEIVTNIGPRIKRVTA